jgi:hypothetical protein
MFSWRAGWKITLSADNIINERAIICICYKWEGEKKVHSLCWDNGDDKEMIQKFQSVIEMADEMVAHNGDRFDIKWYNGRHLIHGLGPILQPKTVDTLKIAKRRFYLNSNSLDYLAKMLLGEGKNHTTFDLWKDLVLKNDPGAMTKMVRYCKKDVVLLERVWRKMRDYNAPATHAAIGATGDVRDRWMCPHCASIDVHKSKTRVTAKGMKQHQMVCDRCGRYYTIANAVHGYYLEAKLGHEIV